MSGKKEEIVIEYLMEKIRSGTWKIGSRIPSEYTLAKKFRIDKATANRAVSNLVTRGYLKRTRGAGGTILLRQSIFPKWRFVYTGVLPFVHSFYSRLTLGLMESAYSSESSMMLLPLRGIRDFETFEDRIKMLNPDLLHKLDQSQKPYVLAARKYPDCLCNFVYCDDLVGARLVADAFYAKGHQSFLYVAASHSSAVSRDRLQGFSSRLSLFGISHDNIHTLETDATREGAFQKMRSWIQAKQQDHVLPVTAIFAFSDYVACGVYAALKEFGYQIPKDISVIGFDNNEFSTIIEPPLTSVDNHFFEIGQRSAQRMLDILDLPENERMRSPQGIITMPELVWRNSVADLSGSE